MFTTAEIIEALARGVSAKELIEMQQASSSAGAEQSVKQAKANHWKERDLAVDCCDKTFRTEKGRAFHVSTAHR
jgi:hypothetical protein